MFFNSMSSEIVEINDTRTCTDFKGITFSNFNKAQVKKELVKSLMDNKIENSCYWCAEFICAGHYSDLWDSILYFYSKHIHLGNPKLSIYLDLKIQSFKEIIGNVHAMAELNLRNNIKIRKLFCEIICILCFSKRKHSFDEIKVNSKMDFDITSLSDKFKADNKSYASTIMLPDDPKELFFAVNEFAYNISKDVRNSITACYWVEWIIEFENICKQKKQKIRGEKRPAIPVDGKDQTHIIWIVWDVLLKEAESNHSLLIQKIIKSLLNLFCLKYSTGSSKKRRYLLYLAISLLTEKIKIEDDILKDKDKVAVIVGNINNVYAQIKKNEKSPVVIIPSNAKNANLVKTITKLEKINSFEEGFIPRLSLEDDDIDIEIF